jgi:putative nucleotidyltransferase with HDIG domain
MAGTPAAWPVVVDDARNLAHELLRDNPERCAHTVGVAHQAERLTDVIGHDEPQVLVAAAWLHDIGYAAAVADTGFHPLDGARYLRRTGWPERLCGLVAHHSGARFVAAVRGLSAPLSRFVLEESPLADAVTYADQTVGPRGRQMSVDERIADMLTRHGVDSPNARAHQVRGPYLLAVAARVQRRLGQRP